jgi:hypothetical protein
LNNGNKLSIYREDGTGLGLPGKAKDLGAGPELSGLRIDAERDLANKVDQILGAAGGNGLGDCLGTGHFLRFEGGTGVPPGLLLSGYSDRVFIDGNEVKAGGDLAADLGGVILDRETVIVNKESLDDLARVAHFLRDLAG